MKPSLICVMCTKPSTICSVPGTLTITNAPNEGVLEILPSSHSSGPTSSNGDRSGRSPRKERPPPPPPPLPASLMERLNLLRSSSMLMMRTLTAWPVSTTSLGLSQKPSCNCETWHRPCASLPSGSVIVTKAPKLRRPLTLPSTHSPLLTNAWKGSQLSGTGTRPPPPPPPLPILLSTIVKLILPSSRSMLIQTSTSWPSSR
mmetsp:Transcript_12002/g.32330  ORF Transcript_12002/g.32330 Transcript_12002/m.32330 type:complete len:202 (-) Transcript_12002:4-609(-)